MNEQFREEIMYESNIGLWIIETEDGHPSRMYGDQVMLKVLGLNQELSPEQLYEFWYKRINPNYLTYISKSIQKIISGVPAEVEYPWLHPQLGRIYIRCGGSLDMKKGNLVRIRGYHQNITNTIQQSHPLSDDYTITDFYKLNKYAPYFLSAYDAVIEVDTDTSIANTILYKKEKYTFSGVSDSVENLITRYVFPDDRQRLREVFSPQSIQNILKNKISQRIEFQARNQSQDYVWVNGRVFAVEINGLSHLLFVVWDVQKEKEYDLLAKDKEDIIQSIISSKAAIVDVNINTLRINILKYNSTLTKHAITSVYLDDFCSKMVDDYIESSSISIAQEFLSSSNIIDCFKRKKEKHIDLKLKTNIFFYKWIRISILIPPKSSDRVFLLIKIIDREYLLQSIMENFIHNSCDYLYYLDLKNDWFTKFSGNEKKNDFYFRRENHYSEAVCDFVDHYIPKEDKEMVKNKMSADYIIRELNKNGFFSFTTGFIDENGNYKRKHIQYQYYDKTEKIVLLQRTDITESYLKQKQRLLEFQRVEKEAKTDFLTQLYNRAGCEQMIDNYLSTYTGKNFCAFLLIDLDNFKTINDLMGHQKGDDVLKDVAEILHHSFRKDDIIARLGGDEFVVFLKDIVDKNDIKPLLSNILKKLSLQYNDHGHCVQISASIGVSFFKDSGKTFHDLYKQADLAMYKSKHNGKNNYQIAD